MGVRSIPGRLLRSRAPSVSSHLPGARQRGRECALDISEPAQRRGPAARTDSPLAPPGRLQEGPLPAPRTSPEQCRGPAGPSPRSVPSRWPPWRAPHRAGGPGKRRGRDGDEPAAGRAPPGRLRLNGSNMATSWKLPLAAAAAGEAAELPPPPPAGPASPPDPGTSAAGAPPLGRPGVSAARREVPAAGTAGTCSSRCQYSLKCLPDTSSSLFISISLQPIDQSLPCLMSCLQEWFLSWANKRFEDHDRRDSSSLSQTIKSGLFMRIWGLHPTVLLLPQEFSVVLPVRAVIGCGRAPSSSSGLRMISRSMRENVQDFVNPWELRTG
ncbi:translation initiation factor IF-2-like [Elephas maximus indicus]|uniref:translation initiation factor IF-2-like n=1 Tax=Elephas maximus indicus TaxID=99487 RepID=UPI0021169584|nr:translation initiation factor IF-2-like [Elephas maximus indicus]